MTGRLAAFVVSLSIVLVCAAGSEPARAQVKVPRLDYRDRTLANGLRVLTAQDQIESHGRDSGLVSRRLEGRSQFPQRLCPPLRAHHVQEHEKHEVRNDGSSD